jgi:Zn-dependent M16 (insulinase) family peptidase
MSSILKLKMKIYFDEIFSPTHKRTEQRSPVWGFEFNSKDATL